MANTFLPDDYDLPVGSGGLYYKLQSGTNEVRILGPAVTGYEWWVDREVTRVNDVSKVPTGQDHKHFWMVPVSANGSDDVQVWTITQATIQGAIRDLFKNKQWGDPVGYNLTVKKTGQNLDTQYSVVPNPKTKLDSSVASAYKAWEKEHNLIEIAFPDSSSPTTNTVKNDNEDLPF